VPSLLRSLKSIHEYQPTEIIVSTPGPVGLMGLLAGRLLNIPVRAVYHTDFAKQVVDIAGSPGLAEHVDTYMKWFHDQADENLVPTRAYMDILDGRGYDAAKMDVFPRGVDRQRFRPARSGKAYLVERFGMDLSPTLVYAGRVSHEKKLGFLLGVYERVLEQHPHTNLLIVGDGPAMGDMRSRASHLERVVFGGRLPNDELPAVYSGCDVLCFPSVSDTFGMAVLEAQACGVPAVVSDIGGPAEIIRHGKTGIAVPAGDEDAWTSALSGLLEAHEKDPAAVMAMRTACRENAVERFDWDHVMESLTRRRPRLLGVGG
jgi:glycosyltransferase involved in cell wall biosynthesis